MEWTEQELIEDDFLHSHCLPDFNESPDFDEDEEIEEIDEDIDPESEWVKCEHCCNVFFHELGEHVADFDMGKIIKCPDCKHSNLVVI